MCLCVCLCLPVCVCVSACIRLLTFSFQCLISRPPLTLEWPNQYDPNLLTEAAGGNSALRKQRLEREKANAAAIAAGQDPSPMPPTPILITIPSLMKNQTCSSKGWAILDI